MDLAPHDDLRARATAFVDEVLIPLEVTAELNRGGLSAANQQLIRDRAVEAGLQGGLHLREHGGRVDAALAVVDGRRPRRKRRKRRGYGRVQGSAARHERPALSNEGAASAAAPVVKGQVGWR